MSRPSNLIYGVSDNPPTAVCILSAAQLLTVVAPVMIYPILVMRETGATDQVIAEMLSLSFLALGVATPLQTRVRASRKADRAVLEFHFQH